MGYARRSLIALLIWVGVVIWLLPFFNVWCVVNPVLTLAKVISQDKREINNTIDEINEELSDELGFSDNFKFLKGSYADGSRIYTITVDMSNYKNYSQETKQAVMQICLENISNSKMSSANRVKIYNFISDIDTSTSSLVRQLSSDVNADFGGAYSWFKPISGTVGKVLGVASLAIFVCLGITIVVDISYITIPFVQWGIKSLVSSGKSKGNRIVSIEAENAVNESESSDTYRNPLGIYLSSKVKQLVALFICLLYLISGKLYALLANIMDYFSVFLIE